MAAKTKQEENLNELSVDELIKRRNEILALLQALEDEHRAASISDESYNSAKSGNQKKLDQVRAILAEFGIGDSDGKAPAKKPEAKSVPDIGVPAAAPAAPTSPAGQPASSPSPGISEALLVERLNARIAGEMEKTRVLIDAVKEGQAAGDERMQRLTESIGELRSMLFSTDNSVKTEESKVEMLEESVSGIDPKRVETEFVRRDKALGEHELRLEKNERRLADTAAAVKDLQGILTSIGGLHNIADVDREITKKLEEVRETSKEVGRTSERFEKMFVELNKRMDEFFVYRAKQESLDEIVRDVIKSIDTLNGRIESVATKGSLDAMREAFKSFEKELDKMNSKITRILPFADIAVSKDIQELSGERETIKLLLSSLEAGSRSGKISKEEFARAKEANELRLLDVEEKIRQSLGLSGDKNKVAEDSGKPVQSSTLENANGPQKVPAAGNTSKADAPTPIGTGQEPAAGEKPAQFLQDPGAKSQAAIAVIEAPSYTKPGNNLLGHMDDIQKNAAKIPGSNTAKKIHGTDDSESHEPVMAPEPASQPARDNFGGQDAAPSNPKGRKAMLISHIEDSYKSGQLSKTAYEHAKQLIMNMAN